MTRTRDYPAVLIVVLDRAQLRVRRRSKSHFSATSSLNKCLNFALPVELVYQASWELGSGLCVGRLWTIVSIRCLYKGILWIKILFFSRPPAPSPVTTWSYTGDVIVVPSKCTHVHVSPLR